MEILVRSSIRGVSEGKEEISSSPPPDLIPGGSAEMTVTSGDSNEEEPLLSHDKDLPESGNNGDYNENEQHLYRLSTTTSFQQYTQTHPDYRYVYNTDSRDEEDNNSSSDLGYSDDSASLSDAYFFPQSEGELGRPPVRHDLWHAAPPLLDHPNHSIAQQQNRLHHHVYHNHYGSLQETRATSPLWVDGSIIQEDVESLLPPSEGLEAFSHFESDSINNDMFMPQRFSDPNLSELGLDENHALSPPLQPLPKRDRRRWRRQQRNQQRRQREQIARERAVTQVRGRPQPTNSRWNDKFFAVCFLVQLLLVCLCAARYGIGVILFRDEPWSSWTKPGKLRWEKLQRRLQTPEFHVPRSESIIVSPAIASEARDTAKNTTGPSTTLSDLLWLNQGNDTLLYSDDAVDLRKQATTKEYHDDDFTIDYQNVIALVSITGFYGCVLTYLSFGFMLILARSLIQIMLIFSIVLSLGWGMVGLSLDPYGIISILGFTALLVTFGHTMYNWNRIPFAATNLYTALCAMRCTADITILGLTSIIVAFCWCVIWSMAFIGIVNSFNSKDCDQEDVCEPHVRSSHIPLYLLLVFSFHWTNAVIKNIVRVTVASAIGTWWFYPQDLRTFCSPAVLRPLTRSLTTSLGSICLGSLIIRPAQALSVLGTFCCCMFGGGPEGTGSACMNHAQRSKRIADEDKNEVITDEPNGDPDSAADTVGLCDRACGVVGRISLQLRACNRWSFTYIGMYGYGFTDAGKKAIQLFETREWMDVVRDNLIRNVLLLSSMIIGGSAGVFAVVVEETDGYEFSSFHKPIITAFLIGSVIGFILSDILLLGVVGSAVNTVLVCFAAGPFEFDKNHPQLSREMRDAWSQQVWEPTVHAVV